MDRLTNNSSSLRFLRVNMNRIYARFLQIWGACYRFHLCAFMCTHVRAQGDQDMKTMHAQQDKIRKTERASGIELLKLIEIQYLTKLSRNSN